MNRLSRVTSFGLMAVALAQPAASQSIADRVSAVRQGLVELHFASRPGVCGDGREQISIGRSMQIGRYDGEGMSFCEPGPVRVRLIVEDGTVQDVRTSVGPARPRTSDRASVDLGAVPASAAAAYFLQLVRTANGRVGDHAITAAVLADSAYPWRELLTVARDTTRGARAVRNNASFWLSRFAAARMSGHENDLSAADDDASNDESEARSSAVFALSQLRNHEGIPPLLQVARTNRDAHVRRQALFWLGQSGDPRALQLFEEVLSGR